jgi:hypothetical protein
MWHWNSWWAPAPGDPPAVDDPTLWRNPLSAEQVMALQARNWETWLSASHAWWSMALAGWPLALSSLPTLPHSDVSSEKSTTVHRLPPPPRKRPAAKRTRRRSTQA